MKSINDLIWDTNQDQSKENSENSGNPVVVEPNIIVAMCSSGGGCAIGKMSIGCSYIG